MSWESAAAPEKTPLPKSESVNTASNTIAAFDSIKGIQTRVRQRIYRFIANCSYHGATCDEIEVALKVRHQTASAIIGKNRNKFFFETALKRPTRSNRNACVWITVNLAEAIFEVGGNPKRPDLCG